MSIFSLSTAQASQALATPAASAKPASSAQGRFSAQLQSLRSGQSSANSSSTTQTAFQTQPRRSDASKAHRPHARNASGIDPNAGTGRESGQTTAAAQSGVSRPGSTGQQAKGGALASAMMRGLQAYGATTTLV
jgi:hypothetical protein